MILQSRTEKKISKTDMENNPSASSGRGSNFLSGFLLGVLVGAAVVFLLGTKKGKKLLKAISEEGAENISSLLEKADKAVNLDEVLEEEEESSDARVSESPKKAFTQVRKLAVKERFTEEKPKARRFFRGISRHLN